MLLMVCRIYSHCIIYPLFPGYPVYFLYIMPEPGVILVRPGSQLVIVLRRLPRHGLSNNRPVCELIMPEPPVQFWVMVQYNEDIVDGIEGLPCP